MLRITMPWAQSWNAWYLTYGNHAAGIAAQRALVDAACRDVGRDVTEIERTVAVFVRLPGAQGRRPVDPAAPPSRARRSRSPKRCVTWPPRASATCSSSSTP